MSAGPTIIYSPNSPDVFADTFTGVGIMNGIAKITVESHRTNYSIEPNQVERVVVGRVVMPVDQAVNMAQTILRLVQQMQNEPAPTGVVQ